MNINSETSAGTETGNSHFHRDMWKTEFHAGGASKSWYYYISSCTVH